MTEKSKPLPQEAHHSWQLCCSTNRESAICIWDWYTGMEGGEEKRKEETSSLTLAFLFHFPCTREWENSYCWWLAQRQHKIVVQRGEHTSLYTKKIPKPLPKENVFLSLQGFVSPF